jgi:hypothetical protein
MTKRIGGQTCASFHRGMTVQNANVDVLVLLMCGSLMEPTGRGGVTSIVLILTWDLWYGNLFYFENFNFYLFANLYLHLCFSRASFVNELT